MLTFFSEMLLWTRGWTASRVHITCAMNPAQSWLRLGPGDSIQGARYLSLLLSFLVFLWGCAGGFREGGAEGEGESTLSGGVLGLPT